MTPSKEYGIASWRYDAFQSVIARLNKRATKLGCPIIKVSLVREEQKRKNGCIITVKIITIEGDAPKLNGWRFVASLEHDPIIGTIVRTAPREVTPSQYFDSLNTNCDHCHKTIQRNSTYIVTHDDGRTAQVGRVCLKDFLGHRNPEDVAWYFSAVLDVLDMASDEEHEWWGDGRRGYEYFALDSFLELVIVIIRKHGWMSATQAREKDDHSFSTASRVRDYLWNERSKTKRPTTCYRGLIKDEDRAEARAVINYFQALADTPTANRSDYIHNISLIAVAERLDDRKVSYAASMVSSYRKAMERTVNDAATAATSCWFPEVTVGQRVKIGEAKMEKIIGPYEGQYGPLYIYKFSQQEGAITLVWFTGKLLNDITGNKIFIKRATIKELREYKGRKETVLSRCVIGGTQ